MMEQSDVVTLMRFNSLGEAEIVKTLLESAGITAVLQNAVVASVLPVYGGLLDIRLVVAREDARKARQILSARFDEKEFEEESQPKNSRRRKPARAASKKTAGEGAAKTVPVKKEEAKPLAGKVTPKAKAAAVPASAGVKTSAPAKKSAPVMKKEGAKTPAAARTKAEPQAKARQADGKSASGKPDSAKGASENRAPKRKAVPVRKNTAKTTAKASSPKPAKKPESGGGK